MDNGGEGEGGRLSEGGSLSLQQSSESHHSSLATRPFALLLAVLFVACVASALEIPLRGIDPDELEHLHAAYCVSRGDVPYRDFFEHHGPALYYLLQPLFWVFGPELNVLWWGRAAMAVCSLGTLLLTGLLARHIAGRNAALPAMCLLAWTTIFHTKAIELRPDVPATLLVVLAACLALRAFPHRARVSFPPLPLGEGRGEGEFRVTSPHPNSLPEGEGTLNDPPILLLIGFIGGVATLFTQKSVVPIAALALALAVQEGRLFRKAGLLKALFRAPVLIALGGAFAWGIALALFALAGAADDLLYSTVYQLWIWPIRTDVWEHLRPTLAADLTVWFAAGMEVLIVARCWRDGEPGVSHRGVIAIVVALCVASLLWAKATYAQYYLLWMPFVTVAAASQLIDWAMNRPLMDFSRLIFRPVISLAASAIILVERFLAWHFLVSHGAVIYELPLSFVMLAIPIVLIPLAFIIALWQWDRTWMVALVAAMGLFYGSLRIVLQRDWSNADQVFGITTLNQQVRPDETILDGFTGYAVLRPHSYYYWWINAYSLALMSPEDRESRLLDHLKQHPPAGVLFDRDLKLLPQTVQDWVRENYRPANPAPLWLRRGK